MPDDKLDSWINRSLKKNDYLLNADAAWESKDKDTYEA
jgi:hypothetical protein